MKPQPIVVVVGRPNVGKSTLFNRLTGSRRALVHDLPGVTRDRIVGEADRPLGGRATIVDTGGLLLEDEDRFVPLVRGQAEVAIRNADAVVFLLDGDAGPIPEDLEIADYLRGLGVPVVPVVNKADRKGVELQAHEFHSLGLGQPVAISAEHGTGIGLLWDALAPYLPADEEEENSDERQNADEVHVAVIGRPNVGKSSLINRLVGDERLLVTEVPGTTRDAVDVIFEREGTRYRFVDTAGIRRKGRTDRGPEVLSVVMARRHLERADLCLLLVDAEEGITRQDAHVGGYAWEAGRAVVLVVNKWDLVADKAEGRQRVEDQAAQQLKFMRHAPQVFLSALNGKGAHRLFPAMKHLHESHFLRVTASELNRVVRDAWDQNPPPIAGKRAPRLYYCSQVHRAPPHFIFFTNLPRSPHFSYMRYLENTLRNAFGLAGVPIRVMIRGRKS
ncbi:MAG: ribosome biogenesis GTPase Der [Thermoanaerobaculales bacterium]